MATIARESRRQRTAEESMKRICATLLAIAALGGLSLTFSHAAPPTVTPSPGYDARLQEQRAASSATVHAPVAPAARPVSRHRKRTRAN
jgi:hypothetical protein